MQLVDWRLTWLQVKYYVDPAYMKTGESRHFLQHLSQHSLHIDVWDGDSLLLIGSCSVDLKVCSPSIGLLCVIILVTWLLTSYDWFTILFDLD